MPIVIRYLKPDTVGTDQEDWSGLAADYRDFGKYAEATVYKSGGGNVWDLCSYNGRLYVILAYDGGWAMFCGERGGEKPNAFGWTWTEIVGDGGKYPLAMDESIAERNNELADLYGCSKYAPKVLTGTGLLESAATPYVYDGKLFAGTFDAATAYAYYLNLGSVRMQDALKNAGLRVDDLLAKLDGSNIGRLEVQIDRLLEGELSDDARSMLTTAKSVCALLRTVLEDGTSVEELTGFMLTLKTMYTGAQLWKMTDAEPIDLPESVEMTAGDIEPGFLTRGEAASDDPSVAWVDSDGNLKALKEGTTVIRAGDETCTVTVNRYDDGSEAVGQLKLLARYNDSMQFYDGHVYLLFTSYEDGVTIEVPDLYAGYEISDLYYEDIGKDISYGSNHNKSTTADDYFTPRDGMKSVTLDRGQIVTIGMYRGFDLTVPQAALGSVQSSTLWTTLSNAVKTAVVEVVFEFLDKGTVSSTASLVSVLKEAVGEGVDYTKLLDGVVDGGVCFNRELYNQKLEWDQYENVTYELDITQKQLDAITVTKDTSIQVKFQKAEIRDMPGVIRLNETRDTYDLDPSVKYTGLAALLPVYDPTITYEWASDLISVDADGLITVTGEIPEEGTAVIVTAVAGSSNDKVVGTAKVILGDYEGARPVGRLTIWARPIVGEQLITHGAVCFTAYEDVTITPEDKSKYAGAADPS